MVSGPPGVGDVNFKFEWCHVMMVRRAPKLASWKRCRRRPCIRRVYSMSHFGYTIDTRGAWPVCEPEQERTAPDSSYIR
jgi:hypothetical protein